MAVEHDIANAIAEQGSAVIGTIPGWITAVTSTGALAAVGSIYVRLRRIRIQERASDREGYGAIMDRLDKEITGLKAENVRRDAANAARDRKLMDFEALSVGLKVRVGQLESALRVAIGELAETSPNSPALTLIRNIMSTLYPVPGLDSPDLADVAAQLRGVE